MKKKFNESPLYRFFNVLLFFAYSLVILTAILAGFIGYSERKVTSATVQCADGTSWDAEKILYDSYALCGICTNRAPGGATYQECTYSNMDYSSYDTKVTKESWTWSTVIYPLVVIALGFGVVDFIRIIIIYIFVGRIALDKSLLLRLLASLSDSQDNTSNSDSLEENYALLLQIVDKEDISKSATLWAQVEQGLVQAEKELNEFFDKQGHDREFFESNKSLELDVKILEEFYELENNLKDLNLANLRLTKYFATLEEVNKLLEKGVSIEKAKKLLKKLQDKDAEEIAEPQVQIELSKAIGEELLELKRQYGDNINEAKVKGDNILERVYKKHPEWRKVAEKGKSKRK